MNSFFWRGRTVRHDGFKRLFMTSEGLQSEVSWDFPAVVKHGYPMDQNTIVVLLDDGSLWQCGAVATGRLQVAAAVRKDTLSWVVETLKRLAPETYKATIEDLQREFAKDFPKKETT